MMVQIFLRNKKRKIFIVFLLLLESEGNIINGFLAKLQIGRKVSFKADVKQRPDNINLRKKTHQIQIHRVAECQII